MPSGDRTGPRGLGSMTGRSAVFCTGNAQPGFTSPKNRQWYGVGMNRGRGGCRGHRNMFYDTGLTGWQRGIHLFLKGNGLYE